MLECDIHEGTLLISWTRQTADATVTSIYCPRCSPELHAEFLRAYQHKWQYADTPLGDAVEADGSLHNVGQEFFFWHVGDSTILLNGWFTVDLLEAIIAHMKSRLDSCTCEIPWLPIGGESCERCNGWVEPSRRPLVP